MNSAVAFDERVTGLLTWLRLAGLPVPVGSSVVFVDAIRRLGDDLHSLYWAGRATLTHSPADIDLYDHTFRQWILGAGFTASPVPQIEHVTVVIEEEDGSDIDSGKKPAESDENVIRFSRAESLRAKDFAELDDEERAEVNRLLNELRFVGATRISRRRHRSNHSKGRPDLRRMIRESLRTGGEPIHRRSTVRRRVPRRVVLLADVSGSMESYSRALVRFAHVAVAAHADVEVFAMGTRLTRLTRELSTHDPDRALTQAAAAVTDWSGGTRLGESLRRFNDQWGIKGMARGAVVVILSDGWDRGDVTELSEQMQRLQRVAYRIVWVNPLKSSPGYAPLAKGMAAALPFVDEFVEGHSFNSLEGLSRIVARAGRTEFPRRSELSQ